MGVAQKITHCNHIWSAVRADGQLSLLLGRRVEIRHCEAFNAMLENVAELVLKAHNGFHGLVAFDCLGSRSVRRWILLTCNTDARTQTDRSQKSYTVPLHDCCPGIASQHAGGGPQKMNTAVEPLP